MDEVTEITMNVIIQSPGFTTEPQLERFVKEKLSQINHAAGRIMQAIVTLFPVAKRADNECFCEIRLEMPGSLPFAKKSGSHFEQAVTETVNALEEILSRYQAMELQRKHLSIAGGAMS